MSFRTQLSSFLVVNLMLFSASAEAQSRPRSRKLTNDTATNGTTPVSTELPEAPSFQQSGITNSAGKATATLGSTGTAAVAQPTPAPKSGMDAGQIMGVMGAMMGMMGGGGGGGSKPTTPDEESVEETYTRPPDVGAVYSPPAAESASTSEAASGPVSAHAMVSDASTVKAPAANIRKPTNDTPPTPKLVPGAVTNGCNPSSSRWQPPTTGKFRLTSCYGNRRSTGSFHEGLDMVIEGPVTPVARGQIISSQRNGGYGCQIVIEHDTCPQAMSGSKCYSQYAHLKEVNGKCPSYPYGQTVTPCTAIAQMGDTGSPGSVHLHFELRTQPREPDINPITNFREWQAHSNYNRAASTCGSVGPNSKGNSAPAVIPGGRQ